MEEASIKGLIDPACGSLSSGRLSVKGNDEEKVKALAKDFESVLIYKLLSEMKSTVGEWGFEKETGSDQIDSLFSMFMSEHVAKNGGVGLWKTIYQSFKSVEGETSVSKELDEK
jgi:Rod binding domain-containing protein